MKREVRLVEAVDAFAKGATQLEALALTYGYDGGAAFDRVWEPLIEKGVRRPLVIADGTIDAGVPLGVRVLRVTRAKSGLFHPKLLLVLREGGVFAYVGSANLTRGGLGGNLELGITLTTDDVRSRGTIRGIVSFVEEVVRGALLGRAHATGLEVFDDIVKRAKLTLETLPGGDDGPLRFLHSATSPIWEQLVQVHGDDPLNHIDVTSPFFGALDVGDEEPEKDSLVDKVLSEATPWAAGAAAPRLTLRVGAVGQTSSLNGFPYGAVERHGRDVEVRAQRSSLESRNLHAKLVVLEGARTTTVMWGSPNFTPAALLRTAGGGGNVEIALALKTPRADNDGSVMRGAFELDTVFTPHSGAFDGVPEAPVAWGLPAFCIGELLYDPRTRALSIVGEIIDERIAALELTLDGESEARFRLTTQPGGFEQTLEAAALEVQDSETGYPRLRNVAMRIVALDGAGVPVEQQQVRINVRFDDVLEVHRNLLLGPDAISADRLLVPNSLPAETRIAALDKQIEARREARRAGRAQQVRHQAQLDTFHRNVRKGLDERRRRLAARPDSRWALHDWAKAIVRSCDAAAGADWDEPRRAFYAVRVADHVSACVAMTEGWKLERSAWLADVAPKELSRALAALPLDGDDFFVTDARGVRDRVVKWLQNLQ